MSRAPAPVASAQPADPVDALRHDLAALAIGRGLRRCYDCGKCTPVCPVNLGGRTYSPRLLGQAALLDPGPRSSPPSGTA